MKTPLPPRPRRRTLWSLIFALLLGIASSAVAAPTPQQPPLSLLKTLFPQRTLKPEQIPQFKSIRLDLNGDKRPELIVVEDPNPKTKKAKKKTRCLCKPPQASKREKTVAQALGDALRPALYRVELLAKHKGKGKRKRVRSRTLKIWWNPENTKEDANWMLDACLRLGRKSRRWRRWRLRTVTFVRVDNGQTTTLRWSRCRRLRRYRKRSRARRWRRWTKPDLPATIKTCPCPKKKNLAYLKPRKPLRVTVFRYTPPKKPATPDRPKPPTRRPANDLSIPSLDSNDTSTGTTTAGGGGYTAIGNYLADNVQLTPLTADQHVIAVRLERTQQLGRNNPRTTVETLYVYDEGNSKRMKKVFALKTAKESDPNDPGARQWIDLQLRNMDADHWLEIVANVYYENTQFSGMIARRMYKWSGGKYVPLNTHRGIARVRTSSTWTNNAPGGASALQRNLRQRTAATNLIDGFRNTVWVGKKNKRSLGDWARIEWVRRVPLLGVALLTQPSRQLNPVVPKLWSGTPPALKPARFVRLRAANGLEMTVALSPEGGLRLLRFPQVITTRYLQLTLVRQYTDPQTKKRITLEVPDKENSHGFLAEVIPLVAEVQYSASSFARRPGEEKLPRYAGDSKAISAWAEGRSDDGIGEWLQMVLPAPQVLQQLTVINGCRRLGEKYTLNNRVKEALLTFSDGSTQTITLKDTHKPQTLKLRSPRTRSVRLTIRSIYKGKLGHTTCLSELRPK